MSANLMWGWWNVHIFQGMWVTLKTVEDNISWDFNEELDFSWPIVCFFFKILLILRFICPHFHDSLFLPKMSKFASFLMSVLLEAILRCVSTGMCCSSMSEWWYEPSWCRRCRPNMIRLIAKRLLKMYQIRVSVDVSEIHWLWSSLLEKLETLTN